MLISILRAGNGLLDGMLQITLCGVGHVGMYRDHDTMEIMKYYFKVPTNMEDRDVICVDPMLATGNSAIAAVTGLKDQPQVDQNCLLAAPEGLKTF